MNNSLSRSLKNEKRRIILGAAFLSSISAFGPSLLTQIAVFSEKLGIVFVPIVVSTGIMNILILCASWMLIVRSGKTINELADSIFHGYGILLSLLFSFCCICFNVGNICGVIQGISSLLKTDSIICTFAGGIICCFFVGGKSRKTIDYAVQIFSFIIISVLIYTLCACHPSSVSIDDGVLSTFSFRGCFLPSACMLFGSYIPFLGGHRLISMGVKGERVSKKTIILASVLSAFVTLLMRLLITSADLVVVFETGSLGNSNPAAGVFIYILGNLGRILFSIMQIVISISCVYASTACFDTFFSHVRGKTVGRAFNLIMLMFCLLVILLFQRLEQLMVIAGSVSGMLTPLSILVLLLIGVKKNSKDKTELPVSLLIPLAVVFILTLAYCTTVLSNLL